MFVTTPRKQKIVAYTLVGLLTINTFVGYNILKKLDNISSDLSNDKKHEFVIEESITDNLVSVVEKDKIKYKEISNLYDQLLINGYDMKDINRELSNILLVKLLGRNVTFDEEVVLFNNLRRNVPKGFNVVDYYYPLACYTHMNNCDELHETSINGICSCEELNIKANSFKIETFSQFVERKVREVGSMNLNDSLDRIMYSDYSFEECMVELDAIYNLCTIPTGIDEETWNMLFRRLLTTTNEFENVCSVYYDLALMVHKLTCEYPHYVNEFGVTECKGVSYTIS